MKQAPFRAGENVKFKNTPKVVFNHKAHREGTKYAKDCFQKAEKRNKKQQTNPFRAGGTETCPPEEDQKSNGTSTKQETRNKKQKTGFEFLPRPLLFTQNKAPFRAGGTETCPPEGD